MISLERAAYQAQERVNEWVGLSTDDKSTIQDTLLNGDKFLEMDTKQWYRYLANNDTWVETSEGTGGG